MIRKYLSLNKQEWNGLVVLFLAIVLMWCLPALYRQFHKDKPLNLTGFNKAVARVGQRQDDSLKKSFAHFKFDPNHLPAEKWKALGLSDQQINTIKNYEAKGGRFYSKQDVKKMYSVTDEDYRRMAPYISLPDGNDGAARPAKIIELNTATENELIALPGIGKSFAERIIRQRYRLGGFHKKEQLKEIFGMDAMTYADLIKLIKVDAGRISKININTAVFNDMMVFPYLTYKQKNAIVEYRNQHGPYTQLSDLKNIVIIDDATLTKAAPYLSLK